MIAAAALLAPPAAQRRRRSRSRRTAESGRDRSGRRSSTPSPGDTIVIPPGEYLLTNGDTLVEQRNDLTLEGAGEELTTIIAQRRRRGARRRSGGDRVTDATVGEPLQTDDEGTPGSRPRSRSSP